MSAPAFLGAVWLPLLAAMLCLLLLAGAAEIHAAAIGLAHLSLQPQHNLLHLQWGLCGVLATSVLAKTVVAWVSGGARYARRVGVALGLMLASFAWVLAWQSGGA